MALQGQEVEVCAGLEVNLLRAQHAHGGEQGVGVDVDFVRLDVREVEPREGGGEVCDGRVFLVREEQGVCGGEGVDGRRCDLEHGVGVLGQHRLVELHRVPFHQRRVRLTCFRGRREVGVVERDGLPVHFPGVVPAIH